jgi:hypothetical protein
MLAPSASTVSSESSRRKRSGFYRSGERGWIKMKNPKYWRRDSEMEAMQRSVRKNAGGRGRVYG